LSYTIDVYRGHTKPEKHLGIFALYVSFFPQLVAGPIERSNRLLPQFYQKHNFDYDRVTNGLKLMVWGFFKKLVIADNLAIYVDAVYNHPQDYQGFPILLATYFFAFQIFCDFSGYSDIAIGAAQIMGFNLMENFKQPYFSRSIPEFWQRWHISLSTWFRDYLYIPLGGNRVVPWRWYMNLMIVFLVSGLWHGAAWKFVVWGGLHGLYMVIGIWTTSFRNTVMEVTRLNRFPTVTRYLSILVTFHLVVFSWIFFRANSIGDAFLLINNMLLRAPGSFLTNIIQPLSGSTANRWYFLIVIFGAILVMELVHILQSKYRLRELLAVQPFWIRWGAYYLVVMAILMFGQYSVAQSFIYFQF
jgi:alginate O-acetyltransferase complex protein AlgI